MKFLNIIAKVSKDVLEVPEEQYRDTITEINHYHENLTKDSKSPIDKFYMRIHKGPWMATFGFLIYVFIRKEVDNILNPRHDDYEESRLDRYK